MAEELWAPFANNLDRWLASFTDKEVKLIRGYTSMEQEQEFIDNLSRRDPAALPWTSAEDSPYPDGLAATVVIPQTMMKRMAVKPVSSMKKPVVQKRLQGV